MIQKEITGQMVIPTTRFSLRPIRHSDVGLIEMFASDKRVAEMTDHIPHPYPPGAAEGFVERVMQDDTEEQVWAIDGGADGLGELLGVISLKHIMDDQSEIGYWVAPQMWNTGLASEALNALVAANPLGGQINGCQHISRQSSISQVVTNAGFQLIGESEKFCVARNALIGTWDYVLRLQE